MNVINNHIGDADFSVETLCEEVGISRASLHRKLKEKTNQSTSIFIRNVRLKQAEKLLLETSLHVSEIATKVGFKHTSYFINSFRELYGMSPNEWKEISSIRFVNSMEYHLMNGKSVREVNNYQRGCYLIP